MILYRPVDRCGFQVHDRAVARLRGCDAANVAARSSLRLVPPPPRQERMTREERLARVFGWALVLVLGASLVVMLFEGVTR